jgi:ribosomal protein S26
VKREVNDGQKKKKGKVWELRIVRCSKRMEMRQKRIMNFKTENEGSNHGNEI